MGPLPKKSRKAIKGPKKPPKGNQERKTGAPGKEQKDTQPHSMEENQESDRIPHNKTCRGTPFISRANTVGIGEQLWTQHTKKEHKASTTRTGITEKKEPNKLRAKGHKGKRAQGQHGTQEEGNEGSSGPPRSHTVPM